MREVYKLPTCIHCYKDFSRIWCESSVIWGKVKKGSERSIVSLIAALSPGDRRKGDLDRLLDTEVMKEGLAGVRTRCS
jgi:hypothetical protein